MKIFITPPGGNQVKRRSVQAAMTYLKDQVDMDFDTFQELKNTINKRGVYHHQGHKIEVHV